MFYNIDFESVKRLSEELERDWSTIDSLVKDFKRNLAKNDDDPILTGEVEIDEMYIHTGNKGIKKTPDNLKKLRKRGKGTYKSGKPPIITMVCRKTGKVIFSVEKQL